MGDGHRHQRQRDGDEIDPQRPRTEPTAREPPQPGGMAHEGDQGERAPWELAWPGQVVNVTTRLSPLVARVCFHGVENA
jgi:hypothetical protein